MYGECCMQNFHDPHFHARQNNLIPTPAFLLTIRLLSYVTPPFFYSVCTDSCQITYIMDETDTVKQILAIAQLQV